VAVWLEEAVAVQLAEETTMKFRDIGTGARVTGIKNLWCNIYVDSTKHLERREGTGPVIARQPG
jgi:hypothetical protein